MEEREHVCQICVSGVCQSTCRVTRILVYTVSRVCGIAKLLYAYRYSTCAPLLYARRYCTCTAAYLDEVGDGHPRQRVELGSGGEFRDTHEGAAARRGG